MSVSRLLGIMALVAGIIILGFGINSSQAITEKVVAGVSGRFTDNTMWYIVGGIAMIVGGAYLTLAGRSRD